MILITLTAGQTMARTTKRKAHYEIDHRLLDEFLGYVLDRYKAGEMDRGLAASRIAFLVAAVALPEGERSDPTKYMQSVLSGEPYLPQLR